jgi:hypothetical protein
MSYLFFYSTNNKHCEKVLQFITKNNLHTSGDFQFISIDQRRVIDSCIHVTLSNNTNYILPHCITSVPTMIDKELTSNQIVLTGTNSIIAHLQQKKKIPAEVPDAEFSSDSNLSYANVSAVSSGFSTNNIIQDTPSTRKDQSMLSIDQIKQDRLNDIKIE